MFNTEGRCAAMGNFDVSSYCDAIQMLLNEHPPLVARIHKLAEGAKWLDDAADGQWNEGIQGLCEQEASFRIDLEIHSAKEEEGLFPVLGRHIGTQQGPIAVMEWEHSEAKRLLSAFEGQIKHREQAGEAAASLLGACETLLSHFAKEENVLFPMAQKILSEQEKEALWGLLQNKQL
ncbi:hemerythrin domain-containing protein [Aneurinibacillus tyrosinisolvens]|uniref:hemerythrin domain-containing protein n=1 Tax=Aneurinibacillus tyrosinisolvens TaxID=1443435 RepID=UPI00069C1179|nr:hemerythrin domain-containing protein [Aneurinibacillus tyrosinisolvens]